MTLAVAAAAAVVFVIGSAASVDSFGVVGLSGVASVDDFGSVGVVDVGGDVGVVAPAVCMRRLKSRQKQKKKETIYQTAHIPGFSDLLQDHRP